MSTEREVFEHTLKLLLGVRTYEQYRRKLGVMPGELEPIRGLDDLEWLAIYSYTTSQPWAEELNNKLRLGKPRLWHLTLALLINRALEKLPRHRGTAYRGYTLKEPIPVFLSKFQVGAEIEWRSFTSCSRALERVFPGDVLFTIKSYNGRLLLHHSASPEEDEVLFRTRTRYRVLGVAQAGSKLAIELEELL